MGSGSQSNTTGTVTAPTYGHLGGSFPHYKKIVMPADQREKILAMHEASRANAGIYVAVVLAMYVFLLTMLLCRYRRRFPSPPSRNGEPANCASLVRFHCCPPPSLEPTEEALDLPLRPSTSNVITITIREPSSSSGCCIEDDGRSNRFWRNGCVDESPAPVPV